MPFGCLWEGEEMADKPSSLPQAGEKLFGFNRQAKDPTEPRGVVAAFCTFLELEPVSEWGELGTSCNFSSLFPLDKLKCTKEEHLCTQRMLDQTLLDLNEM